MSSDPSTPAFVIRVASAEDWATWRALRLRVLSTDPDAFGSTLELEEGYDEAAWRARVDRGRMVLASVGDEYVGLGGSFEDAPGSRTVVSMWVAPEARGRGIGRAILDHVVADATRSGDVVVLWVTEGNTAARALYERAGFVRTGAREPLRPGSAVMKDQMVLAR